MLCLHLYIHLFGYRQWVCWLGCQIYDQTSVGGTKYEFIITGRGYNSSLQIACLDQFIYLFHISVIDVFHEYTLSWCVTEAVK